MKAFVAALCLILPINVWAGDYCGSKEGYLNQIASSFLIPDRFPPENPALRSLVSDADITRCERLGTADLGAPCLQHDSCYQARLDKTQCDKNLQDNWIKVCRATYYKLTFDSQICRLSCESFAKLMSEAQRYDDAGFCPSCDAYTDGADSLNQEIP